MAQMLTAWVRNAWRSGEILVQCGPRELLRRAGRKIRLALRSGIFTSRDPAAQYRIWLRRHALEPDALQALASKALAFPQQPRLSLLARVGGERSEEMQKTVDSLRAQAYSGWELCLIADPSMSPEARRRLEAAAGGDPRVRVCNGGAGKPPFAAGLALATGEFIAFLGAGDELAPEALCALVKRLNQEPEIDVLYCDEDEISDDGVRANPFFKPDWSPDLLATTNYMARLCLLRRRLLEGVEEGGADPEESQEYSLILRATERTARIAHVPQILYHRRKDAPPDAGEQRALEAALKRRGIRAKVSPNAPAPGVRPSFCVRFEIDAPPLVSIIIPTRDQSRLLERCITSVERSRYRNFEIIVVDNASVEPETRAYFKSLAGKHAVLPYPGEFNFAKICNMGAAQARGSQLLFLNNDVEAVDEDWLTALVEQAQRPEVGVVGAKLLYPNGTIQHAGLAIGVGGLAAHVFRHWPGNGPCDPRFPHSIVRDCSAVTGACMMVPRRVFEEVGGFDERFRVVYNDTDLCLRIQRKGHLVVYAPSALLLHHEGATRRNAHPPQEETLFEQVWADFLERGDPYYNPNLTDSRDDWSLRL